MRVNGYLAWCLVATAALPLGAQESREGKSRVPESFTPPAGMCRLWIDGVPASQQPAPTDCASALRNRPSNASVVFGPARRESVEMKSFNGRAAPPDIMRSSTPYTSRMHDETCARDERGREEVRGEMRGRAMNDTPKASTAGEANKSTPNPETAKPATPRKPEKPQ